MNTRPSNRRSSPGRITDQPVSGMGSSVAEGLGTGSAVRVTAGGSMGFALKAYKRLPKVPITIRKSREGRRRETGFNIKRIVAGES